MSSPSSFPVCLDGDKGLRCCWLNGSSLLCVFSFSSLCWACLPSLFCFSSVLFSCFWFFVLLPLVLEAGCWRLWRRWSMPVLVSALSSASVFSLNLHLLCSWFYILSPSVLRWRDKDDGGADPRLCVVPLLFSPSLFLCFFFFLCYSFCLRSCFPLFLWPSLAFIKPENGLSSRVHASRLWGTNASVSLRRNRGRKFALSCLVRFPVLLLFSSLFFFLLFFFIRQFLSRALSSYLAL